MIMTVTRDFCSVVMAMALVTVAVVARVVPASAAAVEIVTAKPTGAAWTALAETALAMAAPVSVTPRLAKMPRSFSSARAVRLCTASSRTPSSAADYAPVLFS